MAFITYPTGAGQSLDIFQWRKMRAAEVPDQIKSGLEVTVVSGLTIRMAPGMADVGGLQFHNTAAADFTTPANTSGATKIWRLVLRLTITADATAAGGSAVITPRLIEGAPPVGAGLVQQTEPAGGVLTWDVPVARFAVTPSVQAVDFLTNDGPGYGVCGWARDNYPFPFNVDTGFPDLNNFRLGSSAFGPQPASIEGMNLAVGMPGIYAIKYSVLLREAQAAQAAVNKPYIRLALPDGDVVEGFNLGANTSSQHGRATISETVYLPTRYAIEPRLYQNTGALQHVDVRLRIARIGVL